MNLIFQNSYREERVIAEVESAIEMFNEINKFCEELNYKIPYTRAWEDNGRMFFDVGSWSEFFILEPCTFEDWLCMCEQAQEEECDD